MAAALTIYGFRVPIAQCFYAAGIFILQSRNHTFKVGTDQQTVAPLVNDGGNYEIAADTCRIVHTLMILVLFV